MRRTVATIAAFSLAGGIAGFGTPAHSAEEIETPLEEKIDQQGAQAQQGQQQEAQQQQTGQQQQTAQQQANPLIATVGEKEIRRSDVMEIIEGLPAGVQQTPNRVLVPAVLEQLITRELILEQARAENLQEDPEVQSLVEQDAQTAQDEAMIEVWLRREIGERVSDADVQAAVEEMQAATPEAEQTPGLVPQVEQALRVQAMADISEELRQAANNITFYGPGGEPVEAGDGAQVGGGAEMEAEPQATGDQGAGTGAQEQQN